MTKTKQLAPRRPFAPLTALREEVDRLLEGFSHQMNLEPLFGEDGFFTPTVDVKENDKTFKVTAELPGLEEKDLDVELTRDSLILKGEKVREEVEEAENFYRKERRFGSFLREIPLPWEVDAEKVKAEATFKHGVLTVTVPKPKGSPSAAKKIPVTAS